MTCEEPLLVRDPEREKVRAQDEIGDDRNLRLGGDDSGLREKPKSESDRSKAVQDRIRPPFFHGDPS